MSKRYLAVSKYLAYAYAWAYAIGFVVSLILGVWDLMLGVKDLESLGEREFSPLAYGFDLALAALFAVVLFRFRNVLDKLLGISDFNMLVPIVAAANIVFAAVGGLPGRFLFLVGLIPLALIALFFGIRLAACSTDLLGLRNLYAFAMISFGVSSVSVFLLPLAPVFWILGSFVLAVFFSRVQAEGLL